ncbi:MAG: hypothetical protein ABF301_00980 [Sulfurovum sp.]|jgi:hypothetical protein
MLKNILLISTAAVLFTGCLGGAEEEKWTAFIYPDKENTKRNVKSPMTFDNLQTCKDEAAKQIEILGITSTATFKCGLNCTFHDGMRMEICEKMLAPNEEMPINDSKF